MTAADKLAQVLAEHGCDYEECASCGPVDDLAQHQAAVVLAHLTAEAEAEAAEIRARVREDARRSLTVGNTVTALYEADSARQWLLRRATLAGSCWMARHMFTSQPSASLRVSTRRPLKGGRASSTAAEPAKGST